MIQQGAPQRSPGWPVTNAFPDDGDYGATSFCDFFIYRWKAAAGGMA